MTGLKSHKIVFVAMMLVFGIGVANNTWRKGTLPAPRFFIGNGLLFLALTAVAEWEPEIANALAIAVLSFAVLGDHGGVLNHYLGAGSGDTSSSPLDTHNPKENPHGTSPDIARRETHGSWATVLDVGHAPGSANLAPIPNIPPTAFAGALEANS